MAWNRLSTYKTRVLDFGDGMIGVQYHDTIIVKTFPEHGRTVVRLDTGGETGDWHTASRAVGSVTTKRKLNQASHQFGLGFSVHQHKHQWFVTTKAGVYLWDDSNVFEFDKDTGAPIGVIHLFTKRKKEAA
jgi:hypothetical protein